METLKESEVIHTYHSKEKNFFVDFHYVTGSLRMIVIRKGDFHSYMIKINTYELQEFKYFIEQLIKLMEE